MYIHHYYIKMHSNCLDNNITSVGAKYIADLLRVNSTIRTLNLSGKLNSSRIQNSNYMCFLFLKKK